MHTLVENMFITDYSDVNSEGFIKVCFFTKKTFQKDRTFNIILRQVIFTLASHFGCKYFY